MTREKQVTPLPGALGLTVVIAFALSTLFFFIPAIATETAVLLIPAFVCLVVTVLSAAELFTVQPNQAAVLILFGT